MKIHLAAWVVAGLAGAVALLAVAGTTTPARLVAVAPADGSTLARPPQTLTLTFTGAFDPTEVHVGVRTEAGAPVRTGAPRVDGQLLTVPITTGPPGTYLIGYHLRRADGRELTGVSRFALGPDPVSRAPARVDPVELAGADPGADSGGSTGRGGGHSHGGGDAWSLPLLGLDAALIILAVGVLLRGPRRRRAPAPGTRVG